jgi:hypothetical protein
MWPQSGLLRAQRRTHHRMTPFVQRMST